jgi:hypothetical protein
MSHMSPARLQRRISNLSIATVIGLGFFVGTPEAATKPKAGAKTKKAPAAPAGDKSEARYFIDAYEMPKPPANNASQGGPQCDVLKKNAPMDSAELEALLGDRPPFHLVARGNNILIFSTKARSDLLVKENSTLQQLKNELATLAVMGKFKVELSLPHAGAVGDAAAKVKALQYEQFDIAPVGSGGIRVSSASPPDCATWTAFLRQVRDIVWKPYPVSPVLKLFYLNGAEVSGALNAANPVASVGSNGGADGGKAADKPAPAQTPDDSADGSDESADRMASDSGAGTTDPKADPKKAKDKKAADKTKKDPAKDDPTATDAKKPADATPPPTPKTQALTSAPDLLVFSEANPGDDAAVSEKRRIIAMLDLPKPEVLVNVWSTQISSENPETVDTSSSQLRRLVAEYNEALQTAIYSGWAVIKNLAAVPSAFYDEGFYKYVAYHAVADAARAQAEKGDDPNTWAANAYLNKSSADVILPPDMRSKWGICDSNQYCLGYTELFHPLKPRLTDLLIAVIAAQKPWAVTEQALDQMEGRHVEAASAESNSKSCECLDNEGYNGPHPKPQFECFRRIAYALFTIHGEEKRPYALGVLRSAIADFLYNWKIAKQYSHEFSAYDLDQSAQAFNTALTPLIEAFNRDVAAYQLHLQKMYHHPGNRRKKSFTNSGVVTVRTVSGKETVVDTVTQSYLDASEAPTLGDLADSISKAAGGTFPPGVKGNITTSAIVGAAQALQPSQAKIGRGIKIDIVPRALSGAASAELDLVMNVDESAEPSLYTAGQASAKSDNTSRVAKHDTTTKMRIDSLRIFEISSLTARLSRSRGPIPLIPPLVQLPFIGTIIGIPRSAATEYHSSIAVLSAIVIPTAADLAYGTRYEPDRIVTKTCAFNVSGCEFRSLRTLSDLKKPVRGYHKAISNCFATGSTSSVVPWSPADLPADKSCAELKFDDVPAEEQ